MALKMAQGSVFAVLLRSPWWYSALIAVLIIAFSIAVLRGQVAVIVMSLALPFMVIAGIAAFKQSREPSVKRIIEVDQEARELPAAQIASKIAATYEKENFESEPFKGKVAELELTRGYRKLLVSSKRLKAANLGIEPLKQLVAAGEKVEATGYLYVTLGDVSTSARDYARDNNIELIQASRLAAHFDGTAKLDL